MADDSKLSPAQKTIVRGLPGWELLSLHTNGDVTVVWEEGQYRFTKEGKFVSKFGGKEPQTKDLPPAAKTQLSLSDELTNGMKKKPYQYEPMHWKSKGSSSSSSNSGPVVSYSTKTLCQENPGCCKPRRIKGVFLDADHTIWHMPVTAASVTGPLKKIDENTVVELGNDSPHLAKYSKWNMKDYLSKEEQQLLVGLSDNEKDFLLEEMAREHNALEKGHATKSSGKETVRTTIKLDPTFRSLVEELKKRHIPMSVISLNTPGSVKRIFREFGLENAFVEIRDSYENKGKVFRELTNKMGICACDAIFVDDNRSNVMDVNDKCGVSLQIGEGKDIKSIIDLLKYVED